MIHPPFSIFTAIFSPLSLRSKIATEIHPTPTSFRLLLQRARRVVGLALVHVASLPTWILLSPLRGLTLFLHPIPQGFRPGPGSVAPSGAELLSPLWFLAADRFLRARASSGGGRCSQPHFDLELLDQLSGLDVLGFFLDLHFLLVNVAHGHIHPCFIHGSHFFHFTDHLIMRLADAGHVK